MNTYVKFLTYIFIKSFFYVFLIIISLIFIVNLLSELDFFKEIEVDTNLILFLTLLNSPATIMEIFPFIFFITTQLFFITLFNNNELEIFKYSGLKNSKILLILSILSFVGGILITLLFYNFSSNLKSFYLELKSQYTTNNKYLAVVTKNGLWIKDKSDNKTLIINSNKINQTYLIENFITEFNDNYEVIRNIKSDKIEISNEEWLIFDAKIFKKNDYSFEKILKLKTNFNYKKIQSLYSNLSSLDIFQLYELRDNYINLNYSITDLNLQIYKLILLPLYMVLITLFSAAIMLRIKKIDSSTFKITLGIFFSVIIYYINNFFYTLGSTEKFSLLLSVSLPLLILILTNGLVLKSINEK
ncbi:MAG: permease [Pelagibacteraceae bacterium]|nr:MAG: permease [Pelagibacteraceae bacterium]